MLRIPAQQNPLPAWDGGGPVAADPLGYTPLAPILLGPAPQFVPPQQSAANPTLDTNVAYPVTVQQLNDRIVTAGRIDPNIKVRRQKIPAILVDQGTRITAPENNPLYFQTLRTAYYLPTDFAQDTRRLNPGFISPVSYPVSN